jgi:hypothetical protein
MLAGLAALMPLGLILLRTPYFRSLQGQEAAGYACTKGNFFRYAAINALLMGLYLPLIFILFGLHIYLVRIDKAFPMMMVNGTVWWFGWTNLIGFFLLSRWRKRQAEKEGPTWADLGISFDRTRCSLDGKAVAKTALLAAVLFLFAYLFEYGLEQIFIVDYRFLFPFASDLTLYRAGMGLLYFPFLLLGFLLTGFFLHGLLRLPPRKTWARTLMFWSCVNTLVLVLPLILLLLIQYVPLLTLGVIPFVGPGGMLANFTMSLFHIIGVLIMVTPLSTWFFQLTGRPYLGALVNASLVTWMFVSSQVIAPIPV